MSRPSDHPPPFAREDHVGPPIDPDDERIDVGVLVVGAGPAGLACAIRFGQLLEEHPEVAERLGEVPLAVVEKGAQPGAHLLSGAVLNPRSLETLLGATALGEMPNYGTVARESVYLLTRDRALSVPVPPTMRNHGNVVVSVSELGRWLADLAEGAGAMLLPETAAERLLVDDGSVVGIRTGDRGRGRDGEELPNFEPGNDIVARVTVLAEGTTGHLSDVALGHFGLRSDVPQVWELGVKEVWRVARPLDRVIHTLGWPLRPQSRYREMGGSFVYPMGDDKVSIGMVVGLDYRDVTLSAHDLLQELKTHPRIRSILADGERLEWGAKTIPGGGYHALPKQFHAPGLLIVGDAAGMVNVPTLKGLHYAIESGRLAAEAAFAAVRDGDDVDHRALATYDDAVRGSFIAQELHEVRDMRNVFGRGFLVGGALAGVMTLSKGRIDLGKVTPEPDAAQPLLRTDRGERFPEPDGKLTFDKLSSVFASGNKTRDDQPCHIVLRRRVPRDVAELWVNMCPAQVYAFNDEVSDDGGDEGGDGLVDVELEPSNCVECGAITAKGGRLTPPESPSGPEYSLT